MISISGAMVWKIKSKRIWSFPASSRAMALAPTDLHI
jgi:hypothetical protein